MCFREASFPLKRNKEKIKQKTTNLIVALDVSYAFLSEVFYHCVVACILKILLKFVRANKNIFAPITCGLSLY